MDYLVQLEDEGGADVARQIMRDIRDRLGQQPSIYRFVRVVGLGGHRSRRLMSVQRLYLGDKLPYLVHYRYHKSENLVHVLRIRHARQRPIER